MFHVAGLTSLRASRDELARVNVQGTRIVLEEALRAGVERAVYTSSVAAIGPAPAARPPTRASPSARRARHPLRRLQARGRDRGAARGRARSGGGDRQPRPRAGPRRPQPLLHRARAPLPARSIPAYVDGAINIVDGGTSPRGTCPPTSAGEPGERYILGNRNFTLDRLFADLGRLSGVEPPALKLPLAAAVALARASRGDARPPADHRRRDARRRRCGGPSARPRPGASWAGSPRPTRRRSRTRSPGTASARRGLCPAGARQPLRAAGGGLGAARRRRRRRAAGVMGVATLYRCPTPPTGCVPAGRRARAAPPRAIEDQQVRVPLRRRGREEVQALTGQPRVPVLGDRRRGDLRLAADRGEPALARGERTQTCQALNTNRPQRGSVRGTADRPLGQGASGATRVTRRLRPADCLGGRECHRQPRRVRHRPGTRRKRAVHDRAVRVGGASPARPASCCEARPRGPASTGPVGRRRVCGSTSALSASPRRASSSAARSAAGPGGASRAPPDRCGRRISSSAARMSPGPAE